MKMNRITNKDWVEYRIGNLELIGFVEDAGEGIYWFSDSEMLEKDQRSLMVDDYDIKKLPLEIHKEDITSMIDLALHTRDEIWFKDLFAQLKKTRLIGDE